MKNLTVFAVILLFLFGACSEADFGLPAEDALDAEKIELKKNKTTIAGIEGIWKPAVNYKGMVPEGTQPYLYYADEQVKNPQLIFIESSEEFTKNSNCNRKAQEDKEQGHLVCSGEGNTCRFADFGDGVIIILCPPGDETM